MPFPSPGDLPDPGIEPRSPALQADALTSEPPRNPQSYYDDLNLDSSEVPLVVKQDNPKLDGVQPSAIDLLKTLARL